MMLSDLGSLHMDTERSMYLKYLEMWIHGKLNATLSRIFFSPPFGALQEKLKSEKSVTKNGWNGRFRLQFSWQNTRTTTHIFWVRSYTRKRWNGRFRFQHSWRNTSTKTHILWVRSQTEISMRKESPTTSAMWNAIDAAPSAWTTLCLPTKIEPVCAHSEKIERCRAAVSTLNPKTARTITRNSKKTPRSIKGTLSVCGDKILNLPNKCLCRLGRLDATRLFCCSIVVLMYEYNQP